MTSPNTDPHKVEYERKGRNLVHALVVIGCILAGITIAVWIIIATAKVVGS